MIGVFPPFLEEPTANMNVPIGMGLMAFFVSHTVAIRVKGFSGWLKAYFIFVPGKITRLPFNLYLPNPLEMVGEIGKVISHSMRLFGNIFGGMISMEIMPGVKKILIIRHIQSVLQNQIPGDYMI